MSAAAVRGRDVEPHLPRGASHQEELLHAHSLDPRAAGVGREPRLLEPGRLGGEGLEQRGEGLRVGAVPELRQLEAAFLGEGVVHRVAELVQRAPLVAGPSTGLSEIRTSVGTTTPSTSPRGFFFGPSPASRVTVFSAAGSSWRGPRVLRMREITSARLRSLPGRAVAPGAAGPAGRCGPSGSLELALREPGPARRSRQPRVRVRTASASAPSCSGVRLPELRRPRRRLEVHGRGEARRPGPRGAR